MTTRPRQILDDLTITDLPDLAVLWRALVGDGGFRRRTLWLVLLDDGGRPVPTVVPVDGIPPWPTPAEAESFRRFVDHLDGMGTPVLLLSRPGPCAAQPHDRAWAEVLAPCAPRWPVHLATTDAAGRTVVVALPTAEVRAPASASASVRGEPASAHPEQEPGVIQG